MFEHYVNDCSVFTLLKSYCCYLFCRCGNSTDDFNVVFYYNEEPLKSICNEGVCSWKEFEDKFTPFLDTKIDFC